MKQITLSLIFAAMLPLTTHAAEFTITETDSVILVEYVGEPDGQQPNIDSRGTNMIQPKPSSPAAATPNASSATIAKSSKPATEEETAEPVSAREIQKSDALAAKMKLRSTLQAAQAERAARYSKAPSSSDPYFPPSFEDR